MERWHKLHAMIQRMSWIIVGSAGTVAVLIGAQSYSGVSTQLGKNGEVIRQIQLEQARRLAMFSRIDDNSAACRKLLEALLGIAPTCDIPAASHLTDGPDPLHSFSTPGVAE